MWKTSSSWAAS